MFAINRSWLVILAVLFSATGTANADIFALFSDDNGATFSNSYVVTTGSTLTVDVFLGQNGGNTELTDSGLFTFGLAATAPSTASGSISSATLNPDFDLPLTDQFDADSIDWNAAVLANSAPTGNEVLLGSFDWTTVADGTTTLSFGDILPGTGAANATWVTDNGVTLDEIIFGPGATDTFDLTIEAISQVPEPGSAALIGFLFVGLMGRRVRIAA